LICETMSAPCSTFETDWINKFPDLLNERKVYWRPDCGRSAPAQRLQGDQRRGIGCTAVIEGTR